MARSIVKSWVGSLSLAVFGFLAGKKGLFGSLIISATAEIPFVLVLIGVLGGVLRETA